MPLAQNFHAVAGLQFRILNLPGFDFLQVELRACQLAV
jgi:hypothetical protein